MNLGGTICWCSGQMNIVILFSKGFDLKVTH